jgi:hypothetical protein
MRVGVGADIKYLLTTNLTLDATINPDFGQVEVDPASLNLSAYETYYDEKRPFFVAGRSAFGFGGMRCMFCTNASGLGAFYSRRIGRPPQLNGHVGARTPRFRRTPISSPPPRSPAAPTEATPSASSTPSPVARPPATSLRPVPPRRRRSWSR